LSTIEFSMLRNIGYEKKKDEKYRRLASDKSSILHESTNAQIFIQAMSLGFKEDVRQRISTKYNNINVAALSDEDMWLIQVVAIAATGNLRVLSNVQEIAHIAEEYANGGIDLLHDKTYRGVGEYGKQLEESLTSILDSPEAKKYLPSEESTSDNTTDESTIIMNNFEQKLRVLISDELSARATNWMKSRIPGNKMVKEWEARRDKSLKSDTFLHPSSELIDYSELGDLFTIIAWSTNWDEVFVNIFKNKRVFESETEQIIMIRRDLAHARGLNKIQKQKLKLMISQLEALIDQRE